jgi:hypothetical protein
MTRIVQLSEFKRRGAGMFIKDLGEEYIVIANEKNPRHSFIIMELEAFIKFIYPFRQQEGDSLDLVHKSIKEKISQEMSKRKKGNVDETV